MLRVWLNGWHRDVAGEADMPSNGPHDHVAAWRGL